MYLFIYFITILCTYICVYVSEIQVTVCITEDIMWPHLSPLHCQTALNQLFYVYTLITFDVLIVLV